MIKHGMFGDKAFPKFYFLNPENIEGVKMCMENLGSFAPL